MSIALDRAEVADAAAGKPGLVARFRGTFKSGRQDVTSYSE
jgi:hypothetical protein